MQHSHDYWTTIILYTNLKCVHGVYVRSIAAWTSITTHVQYLIKIIFSLLVRNFKKIIKSILSHAAWKTGMYSGVHLYAIMLVFNFYLGLLNCLGFEKI